jgi:tRNA nucleotidyltransferase (CCA-adding enzyme)
MADYIYLLESRLSQAQQKAIQAVREVAKSKGLTVFLVGGAVRDLTSGSPVRDLDVAVQGNALKIRKDLEKAGAFVTGEMEPMQALFLRFPGGVRMEVGSTLSVHFPKPGKPVVKPANILEDLRRRDFTANAMALSLNEGSYGLLMDPLNGVADIENRELRLVSNYGFIEDPVRMIRAARFAARLGWQLEEKTQQRYETGKAEGYISALQDFHRGYEAEEIVHEEDPLRVMRRLEQEGWMAHLAPAWGSAKANTAELDKLREAQMQLSMRGIPADASAAQFPLLTAKMAPKDVVALKQSFARPGFVSEIEELEGEGKRLATELSGKQAASPSAMWKMLMSARPEAVLWVAYSTKSTGLQAKFKSFYTDWPQARQKIPYALMQEMRIVPELAGYDELVEKLFFELMDGKLGTVEEMKAYLEPYSPPAPPPPVHLRRPRAAKKDSKAKLRKKAEDDEMSADGELPDETEEGAEVRAHPRRAMHHR